MKSLILLSALVFLTENSVFAITSQREVTAAKKRCVNAKVNYEVKALKITNSTNDVNTITSKLNVLSEQVKSSCDKSVQTAKQRKYSILAIQFLSTRPICQADGFDEEVLLSFTDSYVQERATACKDNRAIFYLNVGDTISCLSTQTGRLIGYLGSKNFAECEADFGNYDRQGRLKREIKPLNPDFQARPFSGAFMALRELK